MGHVFGRPLPMLHNNEEVGIRELGLKNNLKQAEVNTLIEYYKRNDPDNNGLLPHEFKEATGEFMASELTIDPQVIFNIFDTEEGGTVTLREYVLGYAILCRGTTEGRLKYLFSIYGDDQCSGYLNYHQLVSSLKFMQRIASQLTDNPPETMDEDNDSKINAVVDQLIASSSDPSKQGISYDDFIQQLRQDDVVTEWLDNLSAVAGDHLKYIEKCEVDVVELNMQRQGILTSGNLTRPINAQPIDWQLSLKPSTPTSPISNSTTRKRSSIPMPKKQKLVRRDMRQSSMADIANLKRSYENDDESNQQVNAAKPFVINYEQIEFGKILGQGGCATVYQCEWMHVPVAVKVFNDGQGDAAGIEKLANPFEEQRKSVVGDYVEEFWLLLQIRHPNCLLYMGICFEPVVCIVTELYTGGSVASFLHGPNPRKFSPEQALEMISGVARGMYYLHASSPPILHRDLKASNILISQTVTHCVICDFGLSSQFVDEASGINRHSSRDGDACVGIGTPYTMAPEVMQQLPYTPAADVFSFGIVMYEMYTGRFPFPQKKPIQLMFYVTEGNRPGFFEEDKVPPTMRTLIEKCWSQRPEDRPTFEEILRVLSSSDLRSEIKAAGEAQEALSRNGEGVRASTREELSDQLLKTAYRGNKVIVEQLIEQGADVNYADYDGRTPLHIGTYF